VVRPSDALILVNDASNGRQIEMAETDAIGCIQKYPARFSLAGPDPRLPVPQLEKFLLKDPELPVPIITGSSDGVQPLADLIAGLDHLRLILDRTDA
jgi:hypothetical protein